MANKYFQFKQFTIHQDHCAMKVCTDACLFGALIADHLSPTVTCLDIGTGTGVLSLMYSQKDPYAFIDAVEIDDRAALQAKENFESSPWSKTLRIMNANINYWKSNKKYDLIFSNPPFFENNLQSGDAAKNAAKHESSLTLQELLKAVDERLNINGCFAVLLPYHRINYFENEALLRGLYANRKILIRQTPEHELFRGIMFFMRNQTAQVETEMSIRRTDGAYTADFIGLLKDYYLHL